MADRFREYKVCETESINDALKKNDSNRQGFVIVLDESGVASGVFTDENIQRAIIKGFDKNESISKVYTRKAKMVKITDGFDIVTENFKNQAIEFLLILNE